MIDFHTHLTLAEASTSVRSLLISEVEKINEHDLFSVGIHPWYTSDIDLKAQLSELEQLLNRNNVIAVGEIGLDKVKGAAIEKQIEVFESQVMLAEKYKKPVIIHCVRAWAELLESRKKLKPSTPWAIHGFRGNVDLVMQLLNHGMYISLGAEVLNASENLQESIRMVPLNRIFLESDAVDISLKYLYTTVSKIKRIDFRDLDEQINFNFAEFFK